MNQVALSIECSWDAFCFGLVNTPESVIKVLDDYLEIGADDYHSQTTFQVESKDQSRAFGLIYSSSLLSSFTQPTLTPCRLHFAPFVVDLVD